MDNLSALSNKKNLAISFLGILICLMGFWFLEKELGTQILDVLPGYDLALIEKNFLIYGEDGRVLYAWASLTLDLLFPICYVVFFIVSNTPLSTWCYRPNRKYSNLSYAKSVSLYFYSAS